MRWKVLLSSLFDHIAASLVSPFAPLLASPAEKRLWQALTARPLGGALLRKAVVGGMLVDFLAFDHKLIIQVDRSFQSRDFSLDARRDAKLRNLGYRVLRLPDWVLERYLDETWNKIREIL